MTSMTPPEEAVPVEVVADITPVTVATTAFHIHSARPTLQGCQGLLCTQPCHIPMDIHTIHT